MSSVIVKHQFLDAVLEIDVPEKIDRDSLARLIQSKTGMGLLITKFDFPASRACENSAWAFLARQFKFQPRDVIIVSTDVQCERADWSVVATPDKFPLLHLADACASRNVDAVSLLLSGETKFVENVEKLRGMVASNEATFVAGRIVISPPISFALSASGVENQGDEIYEIVKLLVEHGAKPNAIPTAPAGAIIDRSRFCPIRRYSHIFQSGWKERHFGECPEKFEKLVALLVN